MRGTVKPVNITIKGHLIADVTEEKSCQKCLKLNFKDALVMPGLINSHDHLDFNLFPQFSGPYYENYTQWGKYIHTRYKNEIAAVKRIPQNLSAMWGLYKNLLAGVTTVVNHGEKLDLKNNLITVVQEHRCLHSAHLEKRWKWKINNPFKSSLPYVIHTGEGTDNLAKAEIAALLKWNLLNRELIGIHGVAMLPVQAAKFKALVWCPQSNYFLLNRTADVKTLKNFTTLLFGTDSTLTSHWNIWDHIRLAMKTKQVVEHELLDSLTAQAAAVWGLNSGKIVKGHHADLIIVKAIRDNTLSAINPEDILMVIRHGEIKLFDECFYAVLDNQCASIASFDRICINGCIKYVYGQVIKLASQIKSYYPEAVFPFTAA